jgi:hypothetical protein
MPSLLGPPAGLPWPQQQHGAWAGMVEEEIPTPLTLKGATPSASLRWFNERFAWYSFSRPVLFLKFDSIHFIRSSLKFSFTLFQ